MNEVNGLPDCEKSLQKNLNERLWPSPTHSPFGQRYAGTLQFSSFGVVRQQYPETVPQIVPHMCHD